MTPYAITITRQFGSEGREIGKQLAERLHCHYYDRSVIEQEAAQKDESLAALVALKQVEGYYKMAYPLGIGSSLKQEKMFQAQSAVLLEHAAKENCVIVGRCADYALADYPDCINIFIHSDMENRVKAVSKRLNITENKAKDLIQKKDKQRASYYNYYSSKRWGDSTSYHLTLDAGKLGIDGCVDMILKFREIMDAQK